MNVLDYCIKQLYADHNCDKLVCIGDIYEMIWSHSQFLGIMLSPNKVDNLVKGIYTIVCIKDLINCGMCSMVLE